MDGSLGHRSWQDSAVNELPEYRYEVLDTRPAELEEGEIDQGDSPFVAARDCYSEQRGHAAVSEFDQQKASVSHEAGTYYREGVYPAADTAWPPQASQDFRPSSSHIYATTGDASIAEQTWPGPSQGQAAGGYAKYDESQDYSGSWREGYQYSTPASNTQEAHTYDYSAYYDYGYGQAGYNTEAGAGFKPFESASETSNVPADRQPQHAVPSAPGFNFCHSASPEETALKTEPTKRTFKKPDKSKFVLSKNKPIVQPNFLPKLSGGAIIKPRPKKVESKYEAEMRKYQAMA